MIKLILILAAINVFTAELAQAASRPECVNVFYDRGPSGYWMGRTYSIMLQNLLGHFPKFQQIVSPIELYEKGDTEKCRATVYLGSYFENAIPQAFLDDFRNTKKPVAWFGYSIWKTDAKELFGYEYAGLTTLDSENKLPNGKPSFFQHIDYKGETFSKFGDWSKADPKIFLAPFEQVELKETKTGVSEVLAYARHSGTNKKIPYALRAGNRFYVADIPFSFLHEADRYLVTADLLFDILGEPARNEKNALLRIEDVHPLSPLSDLLEVAKLLKEEQLPGNISLVPVFFDPLKTYDRPRSEEFITMDRKPEFLSVMQELRRGSGYSFIWHGVTHQYGVSPNPHNGATGDDFEFWDALGNKPVKEDSPRWVLERLNDGIFTLLKAGMDAPRIWLTPHYQASALDYLIFARVFSWNVGRVIYFNFKATGLPAIDASKVDDSYWYLSFDQKAQQRRIEAFRDLKVEIEPDAPWSGQYFPYEIHGDVYGQRLLPENLGNSQPYISEHVVRTRTPAEIVADAKRNLVIRDSWASLFYHPYLLQSFKNGGRGTYPGDTSELIFLVRELKKLGYKFVSADHYAATHLSTIRPEPIYRETLK